MKKHEKGVVRKEVVKRRGQGKEETRERNRERRMVVIEAGRRKGGQLIESRGERGGWRMGRGGKDCKKSEIMKKKEKY